MRTLLHISCSPRLEDSHSRAAGAAFRDAFATRFPVLAVTSRDLGAQPIPHPDAGFARANVKQDADRTPSDHDALRLSEILIAELEAADAVLIDSPMNNFTVPSTLKAWIDYIVRPRRTFGYTPEGRKSGLLADRPVFVLIACGGTFTDSPVAQEDFFVPYLRYTLGCIGLADIRAHKLERVTRGPTEAARAHDQAKAWTAAQMIN
jgi:FMN-dependent NADH-azoreductase